jgi:type I restriction enzyme S subunit
LADQHRIVSYLDILQDQIRKILLMQTETQLGLDAFLPSILDRAFKGEL